MTTYSPLPVVKAFRNQYKRVAVFPLNASESVALGTTQTTVLQLPPGAVVTAAALDVTTAFNSTGSATIAIGNPSSGAAYLAATTIKTAGATAFTTLPAYSTSASNITVTQAAPAGATAGDLVVYVEYLLPRGQDFSVGDDTLATI